MNTRGNAHEEIFRAIAGSGGRLTKVRKEVIEYLQHRGQPETIQYMATHVSADEVSVYRTVAFLKSLGFVEEMTFPDGTRRFALTHGHHDHIMCRSCGFVVHIPCKDIKEKMPSHPNFKTITEHSVTYTGTCTSCII